MWRYTSTKAYLHIILADGFSASVSILVFILMGFELELWACILVLSVNTLVSLAMRFAYRLLYKKENTKGVKRGKINVAIAGAGQRGIFLLN